MNAFRQQLAKSGRSFSDSAELLREELMTSSRGIADFLNTIAPPSNGDGPLNDVDLRSDV